MSITSGTRVIVSYSFPYFQIGHTKTGDVYIPVLSHFYRDYLALDVSEEVISDVAQPEQSIRSEVIVMPCFHIQNGAFWRRMRSRRAISQHCKTKSTTMKIVRRFFTFFVSVQVDLKMIIVKYDTML